MLVDATDRLGRRYLEVPAFPPVLHAVWEGQEPDACVECGAPVRHGIDRYFQRNDATDGRVVGTVSPVEAALLAITYDCVCGACGDAAILESAT